MNSFSHYLVSLALLRIIAIAIPLFTVPVVYFAVIWLSNMNETAEHLWQFTLEGKVHSVGDLNCILARATPGLEWWAGHIHVSQRAFAFVADFWLVDSPVS